MPGPICCTWTCRRPCASDRPGQRATVAIRAPARPALDGPGHESRQQTTPRDRRRPRPPGLRRLHDDEPRPPARHRLLRTRAGPLFDRPRASDRGRLMTDNAFTYGRATRRRSRTARRAQLPASDRHPAVPRRGHRKSERFHQAAGREWAPRPQSIQLSASLPAELRVSRLRIRALLTATWRNRRASAIGQPDDLLTRVHNLSQGRTASYRIDRYRSSSQGVTWTR